MVSWFMLHTHTQGLRKDIKLIWLTEIGKKKPNAKNLPKLQVDYPVLI